MKIDYTQALIDSKTQNYSPNDKDNVVSDLFKALENGKSVYVYTKRVGSFYRGGYGDYHEWDATIPYAKPDALSRQDFVFGEIGYPVSRRYMENVLSNVINEGWTIEVI